MADFYGCLESTSFRVKNKEKFLADDRVKEIIAHAAAEEGFFKDQDDYFHFGWYGQYPTWQLDAPTEQDEDHKIDIDLVISEHIRPGDVCQIGISGNEKLRYIGGDLCWITSKGIAYMSAVTDWSQRLTLKDLQNKAVGLQKQVQRLTKKGAHAS